MKLHLWVLLVISGSSLAEARNYETPTVQLKAEEIPQFNDDQNFLDMETAIQRQLDRYQKKPLKGTIRLGKKSYPLKQAVASLQEFQKLAEAFKECIKTFSRIECYDRFNQEIRNKFDVFAPDNRQSAFFTGYHTHPLEGRTQPNDEFKYPVYALPPEQDLRKTRAEIDFKGHLKNKGLEIIYTNSLFDLYLLHVEGGGYVTVKENGQETSFYLSYVGTNRQKWSWLSNYMITKGYIANPSIAAQRKFLHQNPDLTEEIYSSCPSYVYFKTSQTTPAGSDLVPLTGGRSLATDHRLYGFKGLLTFVDSERPEESTQYDLEQEDGTKIRYKSFQRFFLDQDTGGAIKGKARADIYFGQTPYSLYAATYQSKMGKIYFLMLKDKKRIERTQPLAFQ